MAKKSELLKINSLSRSEASNPMEEGTIEEGLKHISDDESSAGSCSSHYVGECTSKTPP